MSMCYRREPQSSAAGRLVTAGRPASPPAQCSIDPPRTGSMLHRSAQDRAGSAVPGQPGHRPASATATRTLASCQIGRGVGWRRLRRYRMPRRATTVYAALAAADTLLAATGHPGETATCTTAQALLAG